MKFFTNPAKLQFEEDVLTIRTQENFVHKNEKAGDERELPTLIIDDGFQEKRNGQFLCKVDGDARDSELDQTRSTIQPAENKCGRCFLDKWGWLGLFQDEYHFIQKFIHVREEFLQRN